MEAISVTKKGEDGKKIEFTVVVSDEIAKKNYQVTLGKDFYQSLQTTTSQEDVVKKSFQFLLEREPKEYILSRFDLSEISKYFPEYGRTVKVF